MRPINAKGPLEHVIWDLIGKLVTSKDGNNFISIVVDVLSRFVILRPLRTKSKEEIALRLVEIFGNFGVPTTLQSDNERALTTESITKHLRGMAGFKFRRIMTYFPRTNGLVERYVQESKALLLKVIKGDTDGWGLFVPAVQMALNDRVISRHDGLYFKVLGEKGKE